MAPKAFGESPHLPARDRQVPREEHQATHRGLRLLLLALQVELVALARLPIILHLVPLVQLREVIPLLTVSYCNRCGKYM